MFIWSWHLIPEHKTMATAECQTSLMVSPTKGALIEGAITCVSRFVAMRSIYWTDNVATAYQLHYYGHSGAGRSDNNWWLLQSHHGEKYA
ncbi:hypothetical protein MRX96_010052 [Rhipicephalus microplus]